MIAARTAMPNRNRPQIDQLGPTIRRLREARGWSQGELAQHAGITRTTVTRIETGERRNSPWSTIEAIARALGVTPGELTGSEGGGPTPAPIRQRVAEPEPPVVGLAAPGDLLVLYVQSGLAARDKATHEELQWFASLPPIMWSGRPPVAESVSLAIAEYRRQQKAR